MKLKPEFNEISQENKKEFAEFFGALIPSKRFLKNCGHIGSAITAFSSVFMIVHSKLSEAQIWGVSILALLFTLLVLFTIEKGIDNFVPFWARQLVRWKFQNRYYIGMWIGVTIIAIPLVIASPLLSGTGGKEMVERLTSEVSLTNTDTIETLYQARIDSMINKFDLEETAILARFDSKKGSIKQKIDKLCGPHWRTHAKFKKMLNEHPDWARREMSIASKKLNNLNARRGEELDKNESDKLAALSELTTRKGTDIAAIGALRQRKLNRIDNEDSRKLSKRDSHLQVWGGMAMGFGLFCSFLTILTIVWIELYRAGSGQEYERMVDEQGKEPNKIVYLLGYAWSKIEGAFWKYTKIPKPQIVVATKHLKIKDDYKTTKEEFYTSIPVATKDTPTTKDLNITVLNGIGYIIHNGKKRDRAFCIRQISSYKSPSKKGKQETKDFWISYFQEAIKKIDKMEAEFHE